MEKTIKKNRSKRKSLSMKRPFKLTFGEELGNSVSHGIMWILLLCLLPYYAVRSYLIGGTTYAIGSSIFIICLCMMFLCSCLYHLQPYGTTHKYIFRKLDHIMIVLAIAGTYTPVCLVLMHNFPGYVILAIEWIMAVAGILLKAISNKAHPKLSMTIYMVMGWLAIFVLPSMIRQAGWPFFGLILGGGVLYSIGAVFYSHPEKRYFHFVWHLFIILASVVHMIAILYLIY